MARHPNWGGEYILMGNMYGDSIYQWNVIKGCNFQCKYCIPSFQKQAKRLMPKFDENNVQIRGCWDCYHYKPHIHEERLEEAYTDKYFPKETKDDEFIWACSSGDIYFAKTEWMEKVIEVIENHSHLTFFMQSKAPRTFKRFILPDNLMRLLKRLKKDS
jgi:hypothetical protein